MLYMGGPRDDAGQVNATLSIEEFELLAGIASAEDHKPGRKASLILKKWLRDWISDNPGNEKDMREKGVQSIRDREAERERKRKARGPVERRARG